MHYHIILHTLHFLKHKFQFTMANRLDVEEETLLADMLQNVHEFHADEGPFWQVVTEGSMDNQPVLIGTKTS